MIKLLEIIVILFLLSACATNNSQNFTNKLTDEANLCVEKNLQSEEGIFVSEKILLMKDNAANKLILLSSEKTLTDDEKDIFRKFMSANSACRDLRAKAFAGHQLGYVFQKYNNLRDSTYIKLLKSEINIGEANSQILKMRSEERAEVIDFNNKSEQERQRAIALMLPYLQQQQAQQQIFQQQLYQQQMQNINSLRPKPAVTTNCTTIGNQVNCISR